MKLLDYSKVFLVGDIRHDRRIVFYPHGYDPRYKMFETLDSSKKKEYAAMLYDMFERVYAEVDSPHSGPNHHSYRYFYWKD